MQAHRIQKASIVEAMILVAMAAPALAITRHLPEFLGTSETFTFNTNIHGSGAGGFSLQFPVGVFSGLGRPIKERTSYWLVHIPYWTGPCLVSWTLTAIGMDLRRSGLRPRVLAAHPGSAVGLAVLVALTFQCLLGVRYFVARGYPLSNLWRYPEAQLSFFWNSLPRLVGYTVAVWWLALVSGGNGKDEPGNSSGLGLALGWCWIAMAVASELGQWCFALNY